MTFINSLFAQMPISSAWMEIVLNHNIGFPMIKKKSSFIAPMPVDIENTQNFNAIVYFAIFYNYFKNNMSTTLNRGLVT